MNRFVCLALVSFFVICSVARAASDEEQQTPLKLLTQMFKQQEPTGELPGWKWFCEDPEVKVGDVWKLDQGVLTCKGKPNGYLYTEKNYDNFVLRLQWRWPPGKGPGKGGVLLRMTGPNKIWPKSLEAQINVGDAGDFWGLAGYKLSGPAERSNSLDHPQFGRLTNVKKAVAAEKRPGQWNDYEITADGDTVTLKINGKVVNRATGCETTPGKILLTSEGDAIQFRNVQLITD